MKSQHLVGQASVPGIANYRRKLPHWRQPGAVYFVTWRLRRAQRALGPDERTLVCAVLRHFDGVRYQLHAFVVMDDHVHALVQPGPERRLQDTLHSWKSFSARQLQRHCGRVGSVWQDESFDRVVRDEAEFEEKRRYIAFNPSKRWPGAGVYAWVWTGTEACPTSGLCGD